MLCQSVVLHACGQSFETETNSPLRTIGRQYLQISWDSSEKWKGAEHRWDMLRVQHASCVPHIAMSTQKLKFPGHALTSGGWGPWRAEKYTLENCRTLALQVLPDSCSHSAQLWSFEGFRPVLAVKCLNCGTTNRFGDSPPKPQKNIPGNSKRCWYLKIVYSHPQINGNGCSVDDDNPINID